MSDIPMVRRTCGDCTGSGKHRSGVGMCGRCGGKGWYPVPIDKASGVELAAARDEARARMEDCNREILRRRHELTLSRTIMVGIDRKRTKQ